MQGVDILSGQTGGSQSNHMPQSFNYTGGQTVLTTASSCYAIWPKNA